MISTYWQEEATVMMHHQEGQGQAEEEGHMTEDFFQLGRECVLLLILCSFSVPALRESYANDLYSNLDKIFPP